jgi:threonine/homoserine/homoserine lactone efflux protein
MFQYSTFHWTSFVAAVVLLTISPGPDIAFIIGQTVKGGTRRGFAAMFGIWTGSYCHVLMAAFGLSAIIATSALAFSAVKWVGAAYLIWLGIAALRSSGGSFVSDMPLENHSISKVYWQGVIVSALNPKVAIFFLAFLPQFIVEGAGPVWAQIFLHGTLMIFVAAFFEPPLVLLGSRISNGLRNSKRLAKWLDRGLGAVFVGFGIRLALSNK